MGAACCSLFFGNKQDSVPQYPPQAIRENSCRNNQLFQRTNTQSQLFEGQDKESSSLVQRAVEPLQPVRDTSIPVVEDVETTSLTKDNERTYALYDLEVEEDVCPTCLEEYTVENPRILVKCSHEYHLSCIYEWMERSNRCPICNKLMEFDE